MGRLEPVADGVRILLAPDEVDIVASLAEGLAARIAEPAHATGEDPVLDRFAPEVSRSDPELDREVREMLRGDLLGTRVARLRDLAATLRGSGPDGCDEVFDREGAMRMVEGINDVRLALAATIGYEGPGPEVPADEGRRADTIHLMDALAWLQGGLIDFVDGAD